MPKARPIEQVGLPSNLEAEKWVLGSVLLDNSAWAAASSLTAEDFSAERHRRIFRAMSAAVAEGSPIDEVTIGAQLEKLGHDLASVGGLTFLTSLTDALPKLQNIDRHIAILKDSSTRRNLIYLGNSLVSKAVEPTSKIDETLSFAQRELGRFSRAGRNGAERKFERLDDGRYRLAVPDIGAVLEVDRLRRDRHDLIGELLVKCELPGAKTFEGVLSIGDFNFSSVRARSERSKLLATRSETPDFDWGGVLEQFVHQVLAGERNGQPAVDLRTLSRPDHDEIQVEGLGFPRRHPSCIFGDGGSGKSYLSLFLAGKLSQQGLVVALFDWELCGEDHRDRLELLFGPNMPRVVYVRCERACSVEADRLRRIVRDEMVDFAIFDSLSFAVDGPPEAAEVAGRYFQAIRTLGIGTLHIAHTNQQADHDRRPFGSSFWHNGFRNTWYCKAAESPGNESVLDLALYHRKSNLGAIKAPTGFTLTFSEEETTFRRSNPGDSPDLASPMSVAQRIAHLLRAGPMEPGQIAAELEIPKNTVQKTIRRHASNGRIFIVLENHAVALRETRTHVPGQ